MDNSEWIDHINILKEKNTITGTKKNIYSALKDSIIKKTAEKPFGILFSGGIDSTLIAKICQDYGLQFRCFCIGLKRSKDIEAAKKISKLLKLELIYKEVEIEDVENLLVKVIETLPKPIIEDDNYIEYIVKVSVSAVMLASITLGKEKTFLSGIGAEELFAGYHRHTLSISNKGKWRGQQIKGLEDESWDGIKRLYNLVISRDQAIAKSVNKKINSPYIDDMMIRLSMNLPSEEKIDHYKNKKILREIASDIGVPKKAYSRKKKGAQYGSGFDKAIIKLAKMNGFKLKKRYIESLLQKIKL